MIDIIATILVITGASTDGFLIAGWVGNVSKYIKSYKIKLILFLVFTIYLQFYGYGIWVANQMLWINHPASKWFSIFLLLTVLIKNFLDIKLNSFVAKILIPFKDFVTVILVSGICFFVLGFSINILSVVETNRFFISVLVFSMIIGWLIGKKLHLIVFKILKIIGIIMLFTGCILYTIKIIFN